MSLGLNVGKSVLLDSYQREECFIRLMPTVIITIIHSFNNHSAALLAVRVLLKCPSLSWR
jgi:hypothetical protein